MSYLNWLFTVSYRSNSSFYSSLFSLLHLTRKKRKGKKNDTHTKKIEFKTDGLAPKLMIFTTWPFKESQQNTAPGDEHHLNFPPFLIKDPFSFPSSSPPQQMKPNSSQNPHGDPTVRKICSNPYISVCYSLATNTTL